MRPLRNLRGSLATAALLVIAPACGSDTTAPKPAFTVQEATAIALSMFEEISNAMTHSGFSANRAPASARFTAIPFTSSETFNSPCTNGGTISGSFTFTGDLDAQGAGTASGTVAATPHGCRVDAGTRTIAVGGQMTYTFGMKFSQNAALDTFDWRGAGNFTWDGGNCVIDYTLQFSGTGTGTGTVKGTICGVDISQTF